MVTTQKGLLIWGAAIAGASATALLLKAIGVFSVLAEAAGFSVGAMVGWLAIRDRFVQPGMTFLTWTSIWTASAFLIAALRIAPPWR
jgi:hypothetical protein